MKWNEKMEERKRTCLKKNGKKIGMELEGNGRNEQTENGRDLDEKIKMDIK